MELRHHNIWSIVGPGFFICALIVRESREDHIFQELKENFFSCFQKRETTLPFPEQFISLLDKTPCYIYPTKIADDILPAALLSSSMAHGPVNHICYNRPGPRDQRDSQPDAESSRERWKDRKEVRRDREGLRNLIHISFAVWLLLLAEIHGRVNGITGLSLNRQLGCHKTSKQQQSSPPARFPTKILLCFCLKDTATEMY